MVDLSNQHANGKISDAKYKLITDAEAFVPPLLDDLDKAAAGDPEAFHNLLSDEAAKFANVFTAAK